MIFKIFAARPEADAETDETGTYPDGMFETNRIDASTRRDNRSRSSHERDYGAGRKIAQMPLGLV